MELLQEEAHKIILFARAPNLEELTCILCKINILNGSSGFKTTFQWKILKCRMLIFSDVRVISSPIDGIDRQIYVIMSTSYFKTGKVMKHFEKLGISVIRRAQITKSIYEACLRYTVLARIAPLWNQMGCYLVKGRNFLQLREPMLAVTMDVTLTGNEVNILIIPYRLHIYNAILEDLIEGNTEQLQLQSEVLVEDGKWVYVLPSLKKAQVLSVSYKLPANSKFPSYKHLRRHWKNNYGYRLPEEEECPFYVTVAFGNIRPTRGRNDWSGLVYVYPAQCVCPCPPVLLRCSDQILPLRMFLNDLSANVPNICDHPFAQEDVEIGYSVPKLYNCSENKDPATFRQKLTDMLPFGGALEEVGHVVDEKPQFLTQSSQPVAELSTSEQIESKEKSKKTIKSEVKNVNNDENYPKTTQNEIQSQEANLEKKRYAPVFKSKFQLNQSQVDVQHKNEPSNKFGKGQNKSKQYVFKSEREKVRENLCKQTETPESDSTVEFKNKLPKLDCQKYKTNLLPTKMTKEHTTSATTKVLQHPFPGNGHDFLDSKVHNLTGLYGSTSHMKSSNFEPKQSDGNSVISSYELNDTIFPINQNNDQTVPNEVKKFEQQPRDQPHYFTMEFGLLDNGANKENFNQGNAMPSFWKDTSNYMLSPCNNSIINHCFQSSVPTAGSSVPTKLLNSLQEMNTAAAEKGNVTKKKITSSRSRPSVQVGIDVEEFAKGGLLSKANTTTLITWLRARGVNCRVKDKKSDLVQLVEGYLGLPPINTNSLSQSMKETNKNCDSSVIKPANNI